MANAIKSTTDYRIAALVEDRNRLVTQMDELVESDDFGSPDAPDTVAAMEKMQTRFDTLTGQIERHKQIAAEEATRDQSAALLAEADGLAKTGEIEREQERSLDYQISQMAQGKEVAAIKLRGAVMADWAQTLDFSPTLREYRQQLMGHTGDAMKQDVIGRIAGTGVDTVSDIQPQMVEARFVEVLRNINGPEMCGAEMWYTQSIASAKLPKAIPGGTNPRTSAQAQRSSDEAISTDNNPTFSSVNTAPREFTALFPVERSVEMVTPANIGAKVGELLAREIGEQTARAFSKGAIGTTEEGIIPATVTASAVTAPTWLTGAAVTQEAARNVPTYENVLTVMGKKPDFPASGSGLGDVWHIHKTYAFTLMKIKGGDGQPVFKAMGMRDSTPIDTLYGRSIIYSDYLTAEPGGALEVVAVFGDFWAGYVIRKAGDIELASDNSRFFDKNQVAYRAIAYCAGVVKNDDQFSYLVSI